MTRGKKSQWTKHPSKLWSRHQPSRFPRLCRGRPKGRSWVSECHIFRALATQQEHRGLCITMVFLYVFIQVAKQVRTVPVRGFSAEERFDAEECDLENYASPAPLPNSSEKVTCLRNNSKHKQQICENRTRSAQNDIKWVLRKWQLELGRPQSDLLGESSKFRWSWAPLRARLVHF